MKENILNNSMKILFLSSIVAITHMWLFYPDFVNHVIKSIVLIFAIGYSVYFTLSALMAIVLKYQEQKLRYHMRKLFDVKIKADYEKFEQEVNTETENYMKKVEDENQTT